MTSLAVLPPLQKSVSDLMEDDLYQPSSATNAQAGNSPSLNAQNQPSATQTLSNLLNIPESFVEHYNRVNGSNQQVNSTVPSLFLDSSNDYSNFESMNTNPGMTDSLLPDSAQPIPAPQQQNYIRPEVLQRNHFNRRRRITTLEQPDIGNGKKYNDEELYLFNTDIQPSTLMNNNGSFYPNSADESFFIMDSDLDKSSHLGTGPASVPVPGFESDYVMMDNLAEESDFSDDSDDEDDDNYFQDDDFDEMMDSAAPPSHQFPSPAGFAPFASPLDQPVQELPQLGGFMENLHRAPTTESMDYGSHEVDFNQDTGNDVMVQDLQSSNQLDLFKREDEPRTMPPPQTHPHHTTAAEISANNPTHECTLINPSTGSPCHKHFSRPYDLIRHQETIHAARKKIYRCVICEGRENGGPGNGKSKTFSRGDALSRHIKVKHGISGRDAADLINEAKENVEYLSVC
uniref:C2H2-type domain-containing protein n=1 Tax=Candidozyma auris TaxID=498019 RepID=A0A0L0P4N9_CANAR